MSANDAPSGVAKDDEYAKTGGMNSNQPIPVKKDDEQIDTGVTDPTDFQGGENSDEQLQKDDAEAIDKGNIIGDRTRGGKPAKGAMAEPGDEEGLPGPDDGTSRVAA